MSASTAEVMAQRAGESLPSRTDPCFHHVNQAVVRGIEAAQREYPDYTHPITGLLICKHPAAEINVHAHTGHETILGVVTGIGVGATLEEIQDAVYRKAATLIAGILGRA